MERGARLPVNAAVRCRVRYFTDGAVLGSQEYVQSIFESFRGQFGTRRKSGPRRMKGSDWEGLVVLRDPRCPAGSSAFLLSLYGLPLSRNPAGLLG